MFTLNAMPSACSASAARAPCSSATRHRYPHTLALVWSRMLASASAASAPSRSPARSMVTPAPSQVDAHGHTPHAAMNTPLASACLPATSSVAPRLRCSFRLPGAALLPSAMACVYASSASATRPSEACKSPSSSNARGSVASMDRASMRWPYAVDVTPSSKLARPRHSCRARDFSPPLSCSSSAHASAGMCMSSSSSAVDTCVSSPAPASACSRRAS
mmetsp:Transcript_38668/g.95932  ORF Transcript_38668/g.95932 Transcript_38668/m.95932 type:complete len:218 (+) Transcript_38668:492-1145(+)